MENKDKINLPQINSKGIIKAKKQENEKTNIQSLDLKKKVEMSKIINKEQQKTKTISEEINQNNYGLDFVLIGDLTGSMAAYHNLLKTQFEKLSRELFQLIPNLNIGIIFYLDHGSGDPYITKVCNLTTNIQELCDFIRATPTGSGGDAHEAVEDALNDALNLNWRPKVNRSIVIFGDAAGKEPHQCPHQYSYFEIVKKMFLEKNITINSVYCGHGCSNEMLAKLEPVEIGNFEKIIRSPNHPNFFSWMSNVTGGMIIDVAHVEDLIDIIKTSAGKDTGKLDEVEKEFIHKYSGNIKESKLKLVDIAKKSLTKKQDYLNSKAQKLLK